MDVEFVRWPEEGERLEEMRVRHVPRLILVASDASVPISADVLEDWVRLPAEEGEVRLRARVLDDRARDAHEHLAPELDEDGVLHRGSRWVSLPPVEQRLIAALLDRYRAVVSREVLSRAGWPHDAPSRNVLDVYIVRLRRRLGPLGLVIRNVRSRGYLLEEGEVATAPS